MPFPSVQPVAHEYGPSYAPLPSFMFTLPSSKVTSPTADPVRVAIVFPPLCVADYDSIGYRQAQFLFSLTNSSRRRSCDIFSLTSFSPMLSIRKSTLFTTQPNAQRAPRSNDWHSNETDRV